MKTFIKALVTTTLTLLLAGSLLAQSKETKECSVQAEKYAARKRAEHYNTELIKNHYDKKEDVCFAYTVHSEELSAGSPHLFTWELVDAYEGGVWAERNEIIGERTWCREGGKDKDCKAVEDFISFCLDE